LPGHGTVPAGLTRASWQDWQAAVRLAVREARRLAGPGKPLHIVGYSNGGALAMQYTLDAAADSRLDMPARVVLLSPMIGLTRFARYAGVAGWPALLPRFSKAAWLDIIPEFNPFKYNSFPVNAARQSYELTQVIDEQIATAADKGWIAKLPPVLAFQSVVDSTIAGEALVSTLFARLPENGSELVLFDVNRATPFDILMSGPAMTRLEQMLPAGPQRYRVTVIGNSAGEPRATERSQAAGAASAVTRPIDVEYPRSFFSLSHVAIPFPPDDSLYGTDPDQENFGVHLGIQSPRGERGTLIRGARRRLRRFLVILLFLFFLFRLLVWVHVIQVLLHVAQGDRALQRARERADERVAQDARDRGEQAGVRMLDRAGEGNPRRRLVCLLVGHDLRREIEESFPGAMQGAVFS